MVKATTQRELEEFYAYKYRPIAGGEEGLNLAGVTAEVTDPGLNAVGDNVFDLWPQAGLTDLVRRSLQTTWESIPSPGASIAPLKSVYERQIKRDLAEIAPFGIGQMRAPNASPAIFNPKINYTEETTELLIFDEMSEVTEDLYLRLTGPNQAARARAGVDLATVGKTLQLRHEFLTEAMRWKVFKGNPVIVKYAGGAEYEIKYNYLENHKPSAAVPWTDRVNCTPIDDMRAWQKVIANDVGVYGSRFHMNSYTYEKLQRSNQARGYLTQTDRNVFLPKPEDIESLLWGSTPSDAQGGLAAEAPKIIVTDAGFREESTTPANSTEGKAEFGYNRGQGATTQYLQNGEVLLTTDYMFEGEPIADVADGPVIMSDTWNSIKNAGVGPQSWFIVDHMSTTLYLRQACSRIVRMRRPGAFLLGKAF